jgi:hypothetical protein
LIPVGWLVTVPLALPEELTEETIETDNVKV